MYPTDRSCHSPLHPLFARFLCVAALLAAYASAFFLTGCSSEKFLHEGQTVLSDVRLTSPQKGFSTKDYRTYVRQHPNSKWFSLVKVPLGIYCLSKADSVKGNKGFSKVLRNIGEAPVIYDTLLTRYSLFSLKDAMNSQGWLHAEVDTTVTRKGHKTQVSYELKPNGRFYISSLSRSFDDPGIRRAYAVDSAETLLRRGMPLDLNRLSNERDRVIKALQEQGYYFLNNDFITFDIDTLAGSLAARVNMRFQMPAHADTLRAYTPQRYRQVSVMEDDLAAAGVYSDSADYRGLRFKYAAKRQLNKRVFAYHVGPRPDSLYHESQLQTTYARLNSLPVINYTNIRIRPVEGRHDLVDCDIHVHRNKTHSIGLEVEGTNTSGDLGAALALTYSNRNIFKGSEMLTLKLRGAYEAITGLEGYSNQNYIEWSAEAGLRFSTLMLPFVKIDRKRKLQATSEAKLMYDMQDRPEFHRRVLTGAWSYTWNNVDNTRLKHRFDLLSVNYVYMPWISDTFRQDYLEGDDPYYSVLRYSYDNLFIVKTGYGFTYNSLRDAASQPTGLYQTNGYQIKVNVEFAGNVLSGIFKALGKKRGDDGYDLFGIAYSQYAKFDFDFAKSVVLNDHNSVAFHAALGIGIPYGNSTILPYEKRYFSGGANSVRGWSVRELGPGSYKGKDGKVDFVNQTGNLKLDLSIEWRTYLFWKLHGAFFIDAGNIWNTRDYEGMDGALFKFSEFYKQIAVSYGLGIRFNFDYFILRFDCGMKAIDPSVPSGRLHYPISKPNLKRDFALHFAVGLPF